ncbi:methylenetetrahydrofolate reductase [Buchnera aphidicola (Ceratoglyphina bambusae)]|uniref:methylenetetrahydrofolate reductase n=1 Tax=Buchnera aphidicola TaxID=9 RepID=UPI0031B81901
MKNYNNSLEKIYETYSNCKDKINISFEMFPPNNNFVKKKFKKSFKKLSEMNPDFFSITCSENSGGNKNTFSFIKNIKKNTKIDIIPHLTCVGYNKSDIKKIAEDYWRIGVKKILALRGDYNFKKSKNVFFYASDLIYELKKIKNFNILVAAYPEVHPESKNALEDLMFLKRKFDNGADKAITQFFFDTDKYLKFRDKCFSVGIDKEVIPGILPVYNLSQLKKFSNMTNVKIPKWIYYIFNSLENNTNVYKIISSAVILNIVNKLFLEGIRAFHFYTLNRSDIVYSISHLLRI